MQISIKSKLTSKVYANIHNYVNSFFEVNIIQIKETIKTQTKESLISLEVN